MKGKDKGLKVSRSFIEAVKAQNKSRKLLKEIRVKSQKLLEAIRAEGDDVKALEEAVNEGVDLNQEIDGKLPLQWAIHLGKFERFKTLVTIKPSVGAEVNLQAVIKVGEKNTEMSFLHYAAAKGLTQFVRYLHDEKGMDATIPDKHNRGLLPVHHAARTDIRKTVDALNKNGEALTAVTAKGDFCVHIAAMVGKPKMLEYLFGLGANPSCRNAEQRTPLHCAVVNRRNDTVAFLLKQKGLKDDVDFQGRNALLLAVEVGAIDLVTVLALPDNKFTDTDYNGFGAMHIAAQKNDVKMMRFLKSTNLLTFVATDHIGRVHVHIAAEFDALEAFNFVVDELYRELKESHSKHLKSQELDQAVMTELRQILMNWQDENGDTVLEYAFRFRARKIIKRLGELGLKLDRTNKNGDSLLHQMVGRTDVEMVTFLLGQGIGWAQQNHAGLTPVQVAFVKGDTVMLDLFRTTTDFNFMAKDENGMMLVHWACMIGQKKSLDWLLQHKFGTLDVVDNRGCNCLFNAVRGDQEELVIYLVDEKRMSLDGFCARKLTVMHHAIFKSATKVALVLKKLGVSFEVRGEHGVLPLHVACQNGLPGMVEFLIGQGVNKEACNDFGRNAWFYAAGGSFDLELFNTLERHQIPLVEVLDRYKMSPLHHAAMSGNLIAVKYFQGRGLDCFAKDQGGETPLKKANTCYEKYQKELRDKMKIPDYDNGKNQKHNEEIERLKRRIEGCFDVAAYLRNLELKQSKKREEKKPAEDTLKVVDKRERNENPDGDDVVRIVKPKMVKPQQVANEGVESTERFANLDDRGDQARPPF